MRYDVIVTSSTTCLTSSCTRRRPRAACSKTNPREGGRGRVRDGRSLARSLYANRSIRGFWSTTGRRRVMLLLLLFVPVASSPHHTRCTCRNNNHCLNSLDSRQKKTVEKSSVPDFKTYRIFKAVVATTTFDFDLTTIDPVMYGCSLNNDENYDVFTLQQSSRE